MMLSPPALIDRHGRAIRYLRVSVTDRCDLRCRYCMAETMTFLPRSEVLALEEIVLIVERFIARGVGKVRLTGGEPLVRRDVIDLVRRLGRHIGTGLNELTLTTNGTRLADYATDLVDAGVRRINVSLDSRDPEIFRHITRHGDVAQVLAGIDAARGTGITVKINMVAMAGVNEAEIPDMIGWAGANGMDLTLIETMPLGTVEESRADRFVPLTRIFDDVSRRFTLTRDPHDSGGPARYWRVAETGRRLGLISPLTGNFCDSCNRVRLTTDGRLFTCLGHEDQVDLKAAVRSGGMAALDRAIDEALIAKPARHEFSVAPGADPAVKRHMSVTGG